MIAIKRPAEPAFFSSNEMMYVREKLKKDFENIERQERLEFRIDLLSKIKSKATSSTCAMASAPIANRIYPR
jgi:hypothetical protein